MNTIMNDFATLLLNEITIVKCTAIEKTLNVFFYGKEKVKNVTLSKNIIRLQSSGICNDILIKDLKSFKNKRNDFCHDFEDIAFSIEYMCSVCNELLELLKNNTSDKDKFIKNVSLIWKKHNNKIVKITTVDATIQKLKKENALHIKEISKLKKEVEKRSRLFNRVYDVVSGTMCGIRDSIIGKRKYRKK